MNMFHKNGNMTVIAKAVFDSNMERLRAGESPIEIANTLHEQTKLFEYNGDMVTADGTFTVWYWSAFKRGQNYWSMLKPRPVRNNITRFFEQESNRPELLSYLSAYYEFPIYAKRSGPIVLEGTIIP